MHALEQDLATRLEGVNTAGPNALVVPAEYLDVVPGKRRNEGVKETT